MLIKKITNLLGIAAIGLMMGSSVSYAVKGYGLLGASGDWARLIASNIASSSSSLFPFDNTNPIDCTKYDLSKFTCEAKEDWRTESVDIKIDGNGNGSFSISRLIISVTGAGGKDKVQVVVTMPICANNSKNICAKSHVTDNMPTHTTTAGTVVIK